MLLAVEPQERPSTTGRCAIATLASYQLTPLVETPRIASLMIAKPYLPRVNCRFRLNRSTQPVTSPYSELSQSVLRTERTAANASSRCVPHTTRAWS